MQQVGLNELLEAGVHFGHQTRRWNPKMKRFIFTERNGIHIIDLRKTLDRLTAAQAAVRRVVLKGERVLFVCTKDSLRAVVEQEATRCGAFYVTERWLGGMLTNFQTIRKQIRRLKELERGQDENAFEFYTKKERLMLDRERIKLDRYLCGVKDMSRVPGAIFVVDAKREGIAVREAHKLGIPVVGITDTNADPDPIDFPIPGNDDAIRSVGLITRAIADVVEASRKDVPEEERKRVHELEATTYSTETGETKDVDDRTSRRQPRRKRRPRPEVIAQHAGGAADEAEAAEGAEGKDAASEAPEVLEASAADNAETSAADNAEASAADNAETPAADNAETPAADNAETSAADNAEASAADNAEASAADNAEAASATEGKTDEAAEDGS